MKKLLFLFCFMHFILSCEKDDSLNVHDIIINVSYKYGERPDFKPRLATNSIVMIFLDEGKQIDYENTSLLYDMSITFTDGTKSQKFEYISNNTTGVNTFENVPNGGYILAAVYKPYDFIEYYTIKKVAISKDDSPLLIHDVTLDIDKGLGYQPWSKD